MTSSSDKPTREDLIAICEQAFTPEEKWCNRDSAAAHRQLGEAYALLRAGCPFYVRRDDNLGTYWVTIEYYGFDSFEWGRDEVPRDHARFYIPTAECVAANAGSDWY